MLPSVNSLLQRNDDLHPPCGTNHSQQQIFVDDMVASHKTNDTHMILSKISFRS